MGQLIVVSRFPRMRKAFVTRLASNGIRWRDQPQVFVKNLNELGETVQVIFVTRCFQQCLFGLHVSLDRNALFGQEKPQYVSHRNFMGALGGGSMFTAEGFIQESDTDPLHTTHVVECADFPRLILDHFNEQRQANRKHFPIFVELLNRLLEELILVVATERRIEGNSIVGGPQIREDILCVRKTK